MPYERWWQAISESSFAEVEGAFIHPVQDERVMAGNGTIGLEILDDLPEPDRVLVPFGGGGLSVGIASAVKAVRPATRVYAVEPETGAPLTAAFETGEPRPVEYQVSFVDGSGAPAVLPAMWPRAREALDGAFSVSLDGTAAAVRLLAETSPCRRGGRRCPGARGRSGKRVGRDDRLRRVGWEHRRLEADEDPRGHDALSCRRIGGAWL